MRRVFEISQTLRLCSSTEPEKVVYPSYHTANRPFICQEKNPRSSLKFRVFHATKKLADHEISLDSNAVHVSDVTAIHNTLVFERN